MVGNPQTTASPVSPHVFPTSIAVVSTRLLHDAAVHNTPLIPARELVGDLHLRRQLPTAIPQSWVSFRAARTNIKGDKSTLITSLSCSCWDLDPLRMDTLHRSLQRLWVTFRSPRLNEEYVLMACRTTFVSQVLRIGNSTRRLEPGVMHQRSVLRWRCHWTTFAAMGCG